jgi:hypothetical protein
MDCIYSFEALIGTLVVLLVLVNLEHFWLVVSHNGRRHICHWDKTLEEK